MAEVPGKTLPPGGWAALFACSCLPLRPGSHSLWPGPLTVSQLGDTQSDRNAVQSCSCLLTERRKWAMAGAKGWAGVPTVERELLKRTDGYTGPAPQWAVFCLHGALLGRTYWAPLSRMGRAGEGLEGNFCHYSKLKRGFIQHPCVFVKTLGRQLPPPPSSPGGDCPVRTGRMKAVRGGSWLEYLSIHRSSCRMGPVSNVVCPEGSGSRRTQP